MGPIGGTSTLNTTLTEKVKLPAWAGVPFITKHPSVLPGHMQEVISQTYVNPVGRPEIPVIVIELIATIDGGKPGKVTVVSAGTITVKT